MKKYIDYLFWKRTWFRVSFILLPTWIIIPIVFDVFGEPDSALRNMWVLIVLASWVAAMIDNEDVDQIHNPFKRTGCLDGKTAEEINTFFQSLAGFALTDPVFFEEQCMDLRNHELDLFKAWVKSDQSNKIAILQALNIIEQIQN